MSLIRQTVRGQRRSNDIEISSADLAVIMPLFEGVVSVYEERGMGGTDVPTPALLRQVKLGVNRKLDRLSATVTIKHMKPSKHLTDVLADKALFDADFITTLPATGIRAIYEGSN